ncbi:MAG: hypothetical protein ACD_74C00282G0001 [uncultured bacterium]|nr:MAG: hypothetical protein ACD_74C00282G0001 [uncultured bacterium]
MIKASDAAESKTSESVMVPVPAWRILTLTSSVARSSMALLKASRVPCTSARRATRNSLTFPSCNLSKRFSREILVVVPNSASRLLSCRSALTLLARFSSGRTTNSSPARGTPLNPCTSTGIAGPASLTLSPRSLVKERTLP